MAHDLSPGVDLVCSGLILLVDDDDDLREVAAAMLAASGFQVIAACNGADAIRCVRERGSRPDAIVLDLRMPVMDGPTFLDRQGSEPLLAHVPVIVHTAEATNTPPWPTVRAMLRKPVRGDTLVATVSHVCAAAAQPGVALASGTGALAPIVAELDADGLSAPDFRVGCPTSEEARPNRRR
jgi:CheY-like chemotaxis protein